MEAIGSRPIWDAVLVFPPSGIDGALHSPYPAPHFLAAYLTVRGFRATPLDLNEEGFRLLLRRPLLAADCRTHRRTQRALETLRRLSPAQRLAYEFAVRAAGRLKLALRHLPTLRMKQNLEALCLGDLSYLRILGDTAASHFLSRASVALMDGSVSSARIKAALAGRDVAVFRRLFRRVARQALIAPRPSVVGITVAFAQSMLPALALAAELRDARAKIHVCLGGPVISLLPEQAIAGLLDAGVVDSLVRHGGEKPLAALLARLKAGCPIDGIPGVLTARSRDLAIDRSTARPRPEALAANGARLGATVLARMVAASKHVDVAVPVLHSTGCYWGKCGFCDFVSLGTCATYRFRSHTAVVDDFEHYGAFGLTRFNLLGDGIAPQHLRAIADETIRRNLDVSWRSFVRVDKHLDVATLARMKAAGGGLLGNLGLESTNDRLLRLLNKGYDGETARRFFDRCREAGVKISQVNIIYDIPSTTYEEALGVYEFCRRYMDVIGGFALFHFVLSSSSAMGREPEKFGLVVNPRSARASSGTHINGVAYEDPRGMTPAEKRRIRALFQKLNSDSAAREWNEAVLRSSPRAEHVLFRFPPALEITTEPVVFDHKGRRLAGTRRLLCGFRRFGAWTVNPTSVGLLHMFAGQDVTAQQVAAFVAARHPEAAQPMSVAYELLRSVSA